MMQIMDSIIPARDQTTLFILLGFGGGAFALLTALEALRRNLSHKAAIWTEARLTENIIGGCDERLTVNTAALAHVRQISAFFRNGAMTLLDAPISVISFFILWLIHPIFAGLAILTAAIVLGVSYWSSIAAASGSTVANEQRKNAMALADAISDAGPAARLMGIAGNVEQKFLKEFSTSLIGDVQSSGVSEKITAIAKFARQFAQITILAIGAVLVMNGQISGGAMIAGSIILGKALAPYDQLLGAWGAFSSALRSAEVLNDELHIDESDHSLQKISPEKIRPSLRVENVTVPRGLGAKPILDRIDFILHPGECLAIVGPSGSGKTTLAEIIAGVASPPMGMVRIDGIPYNQLSEEKKSAIVGFAPQSVQFFPGTIAENISRFKPGASSQDILSAVKRSNTEDLIRDLPDGFGTRINARGRPLSLGNARRVALARAIYDFPKLVIFDEPTSDLDEAGEKALISLIGALKSEGAAIVLIAQRAGLLAVADKLMRLESGRLHDFGEKNEVLMRLSMRRPQIDLTPALDETPRLLHWLSVHLSRSDDGPMRARAELALVEIFNILRRREDVNAHEKIAVTIKMIDNDARFDIYCGASTLVFEKYRDALSGAAHYTTDLSENLVALSAVNDLEEVIENDRLRIRFFIRSQSLAKPASVEELKV